MIKKSDLKALLGKNPQGGPFYYSDASRVNKIVQSINSEILMSLVPICAECNNSRTQPHDLAWEWMSNWLRTNPQRVRVGGRIRPNVIFPYDTRRQMLNVHLYFVKLFGGMIGEGLLKEAEGAEKNTDKRDVFRGCNYAGARTQGDVLTIWNSGCYDRPSNPKRPAADGREIRNCALDLPDRANRCKRTLPARG